MPRSRRRESPTNYYHVIMRGNNKRYIFKDLYLKKKFLTVLFVMEKEGLIKVNSWCLMDNHVHLIIQSSLNNLSKSMSRINTSFAMAFNSYCNTYGHVFQDRYKSEIIQDEIYLQHVVRYVHNNPVIADIVTQASLYPWSSYNAFIHNPKRYFTGEISKVFCNDLQVFTEFHRHQDVDYYLDTQEDLRHRSERLYNDYFSKYCALNNLSPFKVMLNTSHRNRFLRELKSFGIFDNRRLSILSDLSIHTIKKI